MAQVYAAALALAVLAPATAEAKEQKSHVSAWVSAGSLGIGPELAYRATPLLGVRGGGAFLKVSHTFRVNDNDYHGSFRLASYGATVDLYPFRSGLRLSAGVRIDRNKVVLRALPFRAVKIGKVTYTPEQIGTLSGTVRAADAAPTFTLGYAGGLTKGLKLAIDAGAMFQGRPHIDDLTATGLLASDPAFRTQLADEENQIANRIGRYKVYPIAQISLGYAF